MITSLALYTIAAFVSAQVAYDTLLFHINLNEDTACILGWNQPEQLKKTLSGPVVMENNTLLFSSEYGYVLYNQQGFLLDSHSVFKINQENVQKGYPEIKCAFPANNSSLLYFYPSSEKKQGTIFVKKLFKKQLRALNVKQMEYYAELEDKHLFNLAHNTLATDMEPIFFALPLLVGYTSLHEGYKWWTLDEYYSFTSPLILENNGKYCSFFPGIVHAQKKSATTRFLINPLQVFRRDGQWYYVGIHATVGMVKDTYRQTIYFFDDAGNMLFSDTIVKIQNKDVIIGEDDETYYTVKKVEKYVFQPSIDNNGNLYYGTMDNKAKTIQVRKRLYYKYHPFLSQPNLAHMIDMEKNLFFDPVYLPCNTKAYQGKTIPNVTFVNQEGVMIKATPDHLTCDGYIVRIFRTVYRDIDKKLAKCKSVFPRRIQKIQDSLSTMATVSCPYSISLSGPKGMIGTFNVPSGAEVLCARVLRKREDSSIVVRLDCKYFAQILLFHTDGSFINKFIFNKQYYKERKDIVVASEKGMLLELDYEKESDKETYYEWKPVIIH